MILKSSFPFFHEMSLSKQNSPRWDTAFCGAPSWAMLSTPHLGLCCMSMSHKKDARLELFSMSFLRFQVLCSCYKRRYKLQETLPEFLVPRCENASYSNDTRCLHFTERETCYCVSMGYSGKYENIPMQYTLIFSATKIENFIRIFFYFSQTICSKHGL